MIEFEVHNKDGKQITVAKFVNENHSSVYNIWEESLLRHIDKITADMKFLEVYYPKQLRIVKDALSGRKLVGTAKVSDGDTYDEKTGREIARKDLIERYKRAESYVERQILEKAYCDIATIKTYLEKKYKFEK